MEEEDLFLFVVDKKLVVVDVFGVFCLKFVKE